MISGCQHGKPRSFHVNRDEISRSGDGEERRGEERWEEPETVRDCSYITHLTLPHLVSKYVSK